MAKAKYGAGYRERFLKAALAEGAANVSSVARDWDLPAGTAYRWVEEAHTLGVMPGNAKRPDDRSPEEKLRLVNEAARLDDSALGEFLRREGIHEEDLQRWRRQALGGLEGKANGVAPTRRVRELERELRRKDKALAETAALLVLSKKVQALLGDEDDDTSEE